jgi:bacterial/archaeal transporter family protein
MPIPTWLVFALLSAVCAAAVALLAKRGMEGVDPTLATAIRSVVMTIFLVSVSSFVTAWDKVNGISRTAWLLIAASGVAGAMSWLFQFRALQLADVSKVGPVDKLSLPLGIVLAVILLGERPSAINWAGIGLVVVGVFLASIKST